MAGLGSAVLVSSSIQYVINVAMTVPALLFVDRWGRRPTLLIGAALMMTWLFANAGLLKTYGRPAHPGEYPSLSESWHIQGKPAKAVIACSYLFVASYACTWGPVSWIYPSELYPLRVRGKAVALATSANWGKFTLNSPFDIWIPYEKQLIMSNSLQLCARLLRSTSFRKHQVGSLHSLRGLLCCHVHSHLLPVPRNLW